MTNQSIEKEKKYMKLTKAIAAAAVFVCGITWLPALSSYASEDPLVDSGIDYTESMETLLNPGAGYSFDCSCQLANRMIRKSIILHRVWLFYL